MQPWAKGIGSTSAGPKRRFLVLVERLIGILDKYDEYLRVAGGRQEKRDNQTEDEHLRNAILDRDFSHGTSSCASR